MRELAPGFTPHWKFRIIDKCLVVLLDALCCFATRKFEPALLIIDVGIAKLLLSARIELSKLLVLGWLACVHAHVALLQ